MVRQMLRDYCRGVPGRGRINGKSGIEREKASKKERAKGCAKEEMRPHIEKHRGVRRRPFGEVTVKSIQKFKQPDHFVDPAGGAGDLCGIRGFLAFYQAH